MGKSTRYVAGVPIEDFIGTLLLARDEILALRTPHKVSPELNELFNEIKRLKGSSRLVAFIGTALIEFKKSDHEGETS
jgi:hypothetical protein